MVTEVHMECAKHDEASRIVVIASMTGAAYLMEGSCCPPSVARWNNEAVASLRLCAPHGAYTAQYRLWISVSAISSRPVPS